MIAGIKSFIIDLPKGHMPHSLSGMTSLNAVPRQEIRDILLKNTVNGVLNVPKEYGMFISMKG